MKTENAKKNIIKTSDFFHKNGKSLLIGGAVLGGLFILYKIVKGFTKSEQEREKEQQISGVGNDVNIRNATITNVQAKNFAQQLLDAMDYGAPFYGTDEKSILNVFKKLQNKDDFLLVFNAFGMKDYNGYGLPPTGWARHIDKYEPRNLVYWLREEVSPKDGEVYKIVKNRVESAGFTF